MKRPTWWFLAVALAGCGQTEATRRTFPVSVASTLPMAPTTEGWSVTVAEVRVSLSALQFFSGGLTASRWPALINSAWAHPGGFQEGQAVAEVLTPIDIELGAAPAEWGTANAVTGRYATAVLTVGMPGLRLRGTAAKGTERIDFDTGPFQPSAPITGLHFARTVGTEPGGVRLTVNVGQLVDRIDFSQTGVADAGAGPFDTTSPAYNGFARGIVDSASYTLTWNEEQ